MRYNEPNAEQRRIAVYLEDTLFAPVTGIAAPTINVSLSGAAFVAASGTWTEVSSGKYYYEATQAESVTDSFLMVHVVAAGAKIVVIPEDIGNRIRLNEPTASKRRLPVYLEDSAGAAVLTAIGGSNVFYTKNGAADVAIPSAFGAIGLGASYVELPAAAVDVAGFTALSVTGVGTSIPYIWAQPILGVGSPPVVSNVSPPSGQPILPDTPLQFDITDADGFVLIIPMIMLDPYRLPEPVTDNLTAFTPLYVASTRVAITDGFRYTLRRKGGWTTQPELVIWAVDINGTIYV